MPELPRLTTDAATPFLKCEAFRLLAAAYKRGSASPHAAEACDALARAAPSVLAKVCVALEAGLTGSKGETAPGGEDAEEKESAKGTIVRAKRLRPVLECAVQVLELCDVKTATSTEASSPHALAKQVNAILAASASGAVLSLCKKILTKLGMHEADSNGAADGAKKTKSSKKSKKRAREEATRALAIAHVAKIKSLGGPEAVAAQAQEQSKGEEGEKESAKRRKAEAADVMDVEKVTAAVAEGGGAGGGGAASGKKFSKAKARQERRKKAAALKAQ